jgi:hypothetical protein
LRLDEKLPSDAVVPSATVICEPLDPPPGSVPQL